jgi:hypothetical protein
MNVYDCIRIAEHGLDGRTAICAVTFAPHRLVPDHGQDRLVCRDCRLLIGGEQSTIPTKEHDVRRSSA